jgi:hypothetical protein
MDEGDQQQRREQTNNFCPPESDQVMPVEQSAGGLGIGGV